jgi:hypothetical protein
MRSAPVPRAAKPFKALVAFARAPQRLGGARIVFAHEPGDARISVRNRVQLKMP